MSMTVASLANCLQIVQFMGCPNRFGQELPEPALVVDHQPLRCTAGLALVLISI
jgi:hypothetical protein